MQEIPNLAGEEQYLDKKKHEMYILVYSTVLYRSSKMIS